jgi:hypothetical protein
MAKRNFTTPQGCIVASIQMQPGNTVSLRYHCGSKSEDYHGAEIAGVTAVRLPGGEIHSQKADLRFVLAPKHVRCRKTAYDSVLRCKVFNENGAELSGAQRARKYNVIAQVTGKTKDGWNTSWGLTSVIGIKASSESEARRKAMATWRKRREWPVVGKSNMNRASLRLHATAAEGY